MLIESVREFGKDWDKIAPKFKNKSKHAVHRKVEVL